MFVCESFERALAEKAHCRITHRHYRRRTRQAIEDRKFTDDGAPAEEGKNALGAGVRNYRNLEEPVLDAVTVVAGIAGPKTTPDRQVAALEHVPPGLNREDSPEAVYEGFYRH
jgi:hypothetical protein